MPVYKAQAFYFAIILELILDILSVIFKIRI